MTTLHCAEYVLCGLAFYLYCLCLEYKAGGRLQTPELVIFSFAFAIGWPIMLALIGYEYLRDQMDGGVR